VTLPFFSLDELLANASAYGDRAGESVRAAYLGVLPWGTLAERQRALDLALLLLPIKKAHEYCQLSQAIGHAEGNPHLAFVLTDGVRRWEAAAAKGLP
jgi:hypothetical protein